MKSVEDMAKIERETEHRFLQRAIDTVTKMLAKKKEIWTNDSPTFENFDIQEEWGGNPVQFGLQMCALKLNRLKKRWKSHQITDDLHNSFSHDRDAEDSLIDLASYALLTLGLLYRQREINPHASAVSPSPEAQAVKEAERLIEAQSNPVQSETMKALTEICPTCQFKWTCSAGYCRNPPLAPVNPQGWPAVTTNYPKLNFCYQCGRSQTCTIGYCTSPFPTNPQAAPYYLSKLPTSTVPPQHTFDITTSAPLMPTTNGNLSLFTPDADAPYLEPRGEE